MKPLVSLGLPVFNGENYLREAIESVLAQDYSNWELLIFDNASEDATEAIAREFAESDERAERSLTTRRACLWSCSMELLIR